MIKMTTTVVADNRMKMGMMLEYIVCGNQPPNSVLMVNPVRPAQKKHVPQKNQAARFTLAWWKLYLYSFATYYT